MDAFSTAPVGAATGSHVFLPVSSAPIWRFLGCLRLPEKYQKWRYFAILVSLSLPCHNHWRNSIIWVFQSSFLIGWKHLDTSFFLNNAGFPVSCQTKIHCDFSLLVAHPEAPRPMVRKSQGQGGSQGEKCLWNDLLKSHIIFTHKHDTFNATSFASLKFNGIICVNIPSPEG